MTSMDKISPDFRITLGIIFFSTIGFCVGVLGNLSYFLPEEIPPPEITPLIKFIKIEGDEIFFETMGQIDILWPGKKEDKTEKIKKIPIGQIPNKNDLELSKFSYLANAKTGKFYPTYTYPARGTEVKYRRFFQTKQAAIDAGFIASKLVK